MRYEVWVYCNSDRLKAVAISFINIHIYIIYIHVHKIECRLLTHIHTSCYGYLLTALYSTFEKPDTHSKVYITHRSSLWLLITFKPFDNGECTIRIACDSRSWSWTKPFRRDSMLIQSLTSSLNVAASPRSQAIQGWRSCLSWSLVDTPFQPRPSGFHHAPGSFRSEWGSRPRLRICFLHEWRWLAGRWRRAWASGQLQTGR